MDTSSRQVSFLERFPSDIWAYLVSYLPGEQLGRLMMTGATLLWQRLKSPTIVKSIKLGQDYIIFKSLPAFLKELPSLEELVIHSCSDYWSDQLAMTIDLLPSGLRKLEMSGKWAQSARQLFVATLTLCKHLPHLETFISSDFYIPDRFWMTHSPQSLTKLSLRLWDGSMELPTSLIHFEAEDVELPPWSFVSTIPPSLESFVVHGDLIGADLVVPLLPPSTTKLSIGYRLEYVDEPRSPEKLVEELPKSLTWLTVPASIGIDFETKPEVISLLTSTLTELKLHLILPCSAWPFLPQQLTKLAFQAHVDQCTVVSTITDNDGIRHDVRSVPFDSLPRSITKLELLTSFAEKYFCGPPNLSNQSYFPPQLTHLSIRDIQLSPEAAKLLPSTLTYLQVGNLCERVCQHLPNSLKTLISFKGTLVSPNLLKYLPQSLTSLHLSVPLSVCPWFNAITGATIDCVSTLPEFAIHEKCLSNGFDWKDTSLPSTLTYLNITNAQHLGDSFLQYQRLPNLLELDLEQSKHFTDLTIPLLPPHLTTLNFLSSSNISGKSFKLLPRSLTCLHLDSSVSIFDADIQQLPRNLKQLYLKNATHLTDLCIPDLPAHLEKLNMRFNSQISQSSFADFPYPLRASQNPSAVEFASWKIDGGVVRT